MSDVKLYAADECQPALGLFVRASDHDALRLEAGSLRGSCKALGDENKHLKRETKRQSKAIAALTAERDALRKDAERYRDIVAAVVREHPHRKPSGGNAPGHGHLVPGVWDSDNGALAGTECAWCKTWNEAIAALQGEQP